MSYLELINNFWQKDLEFFFSADEVNLYFRLLKHANQLGWKPTFNLSMDRLMLEIGIKTKRPFDSARKVLRDAGLIEFINGNGRGCTTEYQIVGAKTIAERGAKNDTLSAPFSATLSATKTRRKRNENVLLHKTKIKNKKSTADADAPSFDLQAEPKPEIPVLPSPPTSAEQPPQPKPIRSPKKPKANADEVAALPLPHPGNEFAQRWATFRASPKQAKKPLSAFELMLTKLAKYPEGFAVVMLERAIQGDWSGVENDGTTKAFTEWQAAQTSRPCPTAAPASFDPDALFGYNQSAADGLAQARQSPDYQRYLAELDAQKKATPPEPADDAAQEPASDQPDPSPKAAPATP